MICLARRPIVLAWLVVASAYVPQASSLLAAGISFNTVVIDAGHGGKDGGCVWNGLIEKNLCLDVAKRLETALKAKGLRVVMTRRTDIFVELADRAALANRHSRSIFVSIHFNASRNTAINGMETFYRSDRGKILAETVLASMYKHVKGDRRGPFKGDIKVLRDTRMTAIVVECGYLSNKTEARRCATAAHRQSLADAIVRGILAARQ